VRIAIELCKLVGMAEIALARDTRCFAGRRLRYELHVPRQQQSDNQEQ
jgi:hypothetical protein